MRENAGVSYTRTHERTHTNKHPHPLSLALTLICVRQVHHPVLPQVPVNGVSIRWIGRATGAGMGVDEGLISSERLLCFSNDGLNERPPALPLTHSVTSNSKLFVNKGTDTHCGPHQYPHFVTSFILHTLSIFLELNIKESTGIYFSHVKN